MAIRARTIRLKSRSLVTVVTSLALRPQSAVAMRVDRRMPSDHPRIFSPPPLSEDWGHREGWALGGASSWPSLHEEVNGSNNLFVGAYPDAPKEPRNSRTTRH